MPRAHVRALIAAGVAWGFGGRLLRHVAARLGLRLRLTLISLRLRFALGFFCVCLLARVVRHIPTRTFELNAGRRPLFFKFAAALLAARERLVRELLQNFDVRVALPTGIFVDRHNAFLLRKFQREIGANPVRLYEPKLCRATLLFFDACTLQFDCNGRCNTTGKFIFDDNFLAALQDEGLAD